MTALNPSTLRIRSQAGKKARGTSARMTKARARSISLTLRETAGHALLALPELPPSANALFANAASGRTKTALYRLWLAAAVQDLRQVQRAPLIKGRITVAIVAQRPTGRRDIDNLAKPLLDLLVKAEVIEDDSLVERLSLHWSDAIKGVQIAVGSA